MSREEMINFKNETLDSIKKYGKTENEILFIGTFDYKVSIQDFWGLSDFDYDNSFGAQHIPEDLIVVFDDFSWLERQEYDGSESWVFYKAPVLPRDTRKIKRIYNKGYLTLAETQLEPRE